MTQLEQTYIKKLKAFNNYLLKYSGSSMRIENFKREIDELEKQIRFEMLCDPDIYEASANEHFEEQIQLEKKCKNCKWGKVSYGHCVWCTHQHPFYKELSGYGDNFEPKTDE